MSAIMNFLTTYSLPIVSILSMMIPIIGYIIYVYVKDCLHVFSYITTYYDKYEDCDLTKEKQDIIKFADEAMTLSRDEYNKIVEDFIATYEKKNIPDGHGLFPEIDDITMKVARELAIGTGGGRAVVFQLYHPFVTKGIELHSNIAFGIQKRFYNTFKYMFAMLFDTREKAVKAGKIVRSLHDKVKGELNDDFGGIYNYTSKFDASQKEALAWVGATLAETALFEYELIVDDLSIKQKNEIVNELRKIGVMFGLPISPDTKITYDEFMRYFMAMLDSDVLAYNESTQYIIDLILEPPSTIHKPIFWFARWYSAVIMPERFQKALFGRKITFLDQIAFSLLIGGYRSFYRLTPVCMRYENIYLRKEKRHGIKRGMIENFLASVARFIGKTAVSFLFPTRSEAKVREAKEQLNERKRRYAEERAKREKLLAEN